MPVKHRAVQQPYVRARAGSAVRQPQVYWLPLAGSLCQPPHPLQCAGFRPVTARPWRRAAAARYSDA